MNGSAATRAWGFVNGFEVPGLTPEKRDLWKALIDHMSEEQFIAGVDKTRNRPTDQLHLRPSSKPFRAYAGSITATRRPRDPGGCSQCERGW